MADVRDIPVARPFPERIGRYEIHVDVVPPLAASVVAPSDATANTTSVSTSQGLPSLPSAYPHNLRAFALVGLGALVVGAGLAWLGVSRSTAASNEPDAASSTWLGLGGASVDGGTAKDSASAVAEVPIAAATASSADAAVPTASAQPEGSSAAAPRPAGDKAPLAKKPASALLVPSVRPIVGKPARSGGDSFGDGRK